MDVNSFNITGEVDHSTPFCVYLDIARSHGIKINEEKLNENPYIYHLLREIVTYQPTITDNLRCVAMFINNKCKNWTKRTLLDAYQFLITIDNFDSEVEVGSQTTETPRAYGPRALYSLCRKYKILTTFTTSMGQMKSSLNALYNPEPMRTNLLRTLNTLTSSELVNISNYMKIRLPSSNNVREKVSVEADFFNKFKNLEFLRNHFNPSTNGEAIAVAAINYKMDISLAKDPLREFFNLRNSKNHRTQYCPLDFTLGEIYNKNPGLLDLSKEYNPSLPRELYSKRHLMTLAKKEGYTEYEINDSPEECLQTINIINSFWNGWRPGIITKETPILNEELHEIPKDSLLCYGCKENGFLIIRYSELGDNFLHGQAFLNIFQGNKIHFEDREILKLKLLASEDCDEEYNSERLELFQIISQIEMKIKRGKSADKQFFLDYRSLQLEERRNVENLIKEIMNIGMYMRGWDGKSEYPIETALVNDQSMVDFRVQNAIHDYRKKKNYGIDELVIYQYKEHNFIQSLSREKLGKRMSLVLEGENSDDISSCIRLSSNYVVATAIYYGNLLGMFLNFKINKLRSIS